MVESVDGVGELLEDLKKNTFQKYDAFTVGEVFNMKPDELPEFIEKPVIFQRYLILVHIVSVMENMDGMMLRRWNFLNGEKQSSSLRWKHRSMDLKQIL